MTGKAGAEELVLRRLSAGPAAVRDLVDGLRAEGVSRDDAVAIMMDLERDGRLSLSESAPYASIRAYALSPLSLWFWASLAAVGASVGLAGVTAGQAVYLRYAFGGALLFFFPGYSLVESLYLMSELEPLTRFALSIGLSLVLVPLVGLVLNFLPLGIRLAPVVASLAGLSVILLVVALLRKYSRYRLARGSPK